MLTSRSKLKDGKYLSKAMGMRDTKELTMEGLTILKNYEFIYFIKIKLCL